MNEHFFKTLKIENFRGIKSLEINDLARVNLFVGRNNCGKTSVLEAAFLLADIGNPNLLINVQNNLRGVVLKESSDMKDFFHNRKYAKGTELSCVQMKGKRHLKISPLYDDLKIGQTGGVHSKLAENGAVGRVSEFNVGISAAGQSVAGFEYKFTVSNPATGKSRNHGSTVKFTMPGSLEFTTTFDKNYRESVRSLFLGVRGYTHDFVDKMLNEKKKDVLLSTLKSIDPNVKDIKTGSNNLVSVDIDLDSYIPINLLGDGIVRILNILSGIDVTQDGVLAIDEIENGLHVTALERAWEVILEQSAKSNTQIFITTHSNDAIEGLEKSLSAYNGKLLDDENETVACYRLVKHTNGDTRAYRYSAEQLRQALDSDTDIRI